MTHTPGPWGFDDNKPGFVTARGGPDICEVFGEAARADECDFNHALIAAAPELLAALKAHIPWREEPPQGWGMWADAVAAINKAEGRGINYWEDEDEDEGRVE